LEDNTFFRLAPLRFITVSVAPGLEGVAFSLKDCLTILQEQGLELEQMRATGGGAKSPLWRQIITDVLGVELVITNVSEGPAFGAALLAGVASGFRIWVSLGRFLKCPREQMPSSTWLLFRHRISNPQSSPFVTIP